MDSIHKVLRLLLLQVFTKSFFPSLTQLNSYKGYPYVISPKQGKATWHWISQQCCGSAQFTTFLSITTTGSNMFIPILLWKTLSLTDIKLPATLCSNWSYKRLKVFYNWLHTCCHLSPPYPKTAASNCKVTRHRFWTCQLSRLGQRQVTQKTRSLTLYTLT